MKYNQQADAECAIAQALGVVGDWWTLLVIRDVVGGLHRFDELQAELGISRKVLTERLGSLVEHGVLEKRLYRARPARYEYHVTATGRGLVPVLVALQDWGARYVVGDGTLTATGRPRSMEAGRLRRLVGTRVPALSLRDGDGLRDPVSDRDWTVLYCYPGAYAKVDAYPPGWSMIPGASGCTLESVTYRDRLPEFDALHAQVYGVSTQTPDEQRAFAASQRLPFPLLSDQDLNLAATLRLPTFRPAGSDHLKRLTLLVRRDREIRGVLYPLPDPAGSVEDALALLRRETHAAGRRGA